MISPFQPVLCIYHSPCNDGFTAAWIVHNYHKKLDQAVELYPAQYNREPPLELCKGKIVYIVDFSYLAWPLEQICDVAKDVIVIDHHKTALPLLDTEPRDNLNLTINLEHSGAMLTWQHFYGEDSPPWIVRYVEDRDMWWKRLEQCDNIHYLLSSYEPNITIWDNLAARLESSSDYMSICDEGAAIQRYNNSWLSDHLLTHTKHILLSGFIVPSINIPGIFASDACSILAKSNPFALAWYQSKLQLHCSLRSSANYSYAQDVSEIAKKLGGGGHKHAAGFTLPITKASLILGD